MAESLIYYNDIQINVAWLKGRNTPTLESQRKILSALTHKTEALLQNRAAQAQPTNEEDRSFSPLAIYGKKILTTVLSDLLASSKLYMEGTTDELQIRPFEPIDRKQSLPLAFMLAINPDVLPYAMVSDTSERNTNWGELRQLFIETAARLVNTRNLAWRNLRGDELLALVIMGFTDEKIEEYLNHNKLPYTAGEFTAARKTQFTMFSSHAALQNVGSKTGFAFIPNLYAGVVSPLPTYPEHIPYEGSILPWIFLERAAKKIVTTTFNKWGYTSLV